MKKRGILIILTIFLACNFNDKRPIVGETMYQKNLNSLFKDASKSPLKKKDLRNFKGLDFFPVDSSLFTFFSKVYGTVHILRKRKN